MYRERVTEKMVEVGCLDVACVGREEEGVDPTWVFESQRGQAGWLLFHWPVGEKEGAWLGRVHALAEPQTAKPIHTTTSLTT